MNENLYAPPNSHVADAVSGPDGLTAVGIVTFDQLRQSDKWRFFWDYLWRSLVAAVLSGLGGGIIGGALGAVIGGVGTALGKPITQMLLTLQTVGVIIGGVVGLVAIWQLIRWLFRARWFGYRLRLVRDTT